MLSESLRSVREGQRRQVKYISERSREKTENPESAGYGRARYSSKACFHSVIMVYAIFTVMVTRFIEAAFCRKLRWYRD